MRDALSIEIMEVSAGEDIDIQKLGKVAFGSFLSKTRAPFLQATHVQECTALQPG